MTYQFRALAEQAQADGQITAAEILALRRDGWADGRIEAAEAEAIFVLNDRLAERTAEWSDFFVEALTEHVLSGSSPRGFVSDEQADWLIARLGRSDRVETMAELDLLARLFDKAEQLPERLKTYALAEIEQIVLTGSGATRGGGEVAPGQITAAECRLLRRILFSFAGETPGGISRAEAELLFRLKDASLEADNAPEWAQLFVQGVGNYLLGHNRFGPLSGERAAQLDSFMNDATPRLGVFLGRMARSDIGGSCGDQARRVFGFGRKGAARDLDAEMAADAGMTEAEDAWLQAQVDSDNQFDDLEKALLRFIAAEERR